MKKFFCAAALFFAITVLFGVCAYAQSWTSTADFSYHEVGGADCFAMQVSEFDVSVRKANMNGYMGYTSAQNAVSTWNSCGVIVSIANGYFEVRDGAALTNNKRLAAQSGKTYHVVCKMDFTKKTFDVTVDGTTIATSAAFRSDAPEMKSAGNMVVRGGSGEAAGEFTVSNHTMLSLPNVFAENMVIARGMPFRIWGTAKAGEKVSFTFANKSFETTADASGSFCVETDAPAAGKTPYTLTIAAGEAKGEIKNVFVGDVYVLAGQSNMAQCYNHQTTEQMGGGVTMSNIPSRIANTMIKHFTLKQSDSAAATYNVPLLNGTWQPLSEDNNKTLSYIGQFFANEQLKENGDIPIGLMSVAWRGTTINRWMRLSDDNKTENYTPSNGKIFNNHIYPLLNYNVTGILWYQGESDAGAPNMYAEAFPRMIDDYRALWRDESLPFLYVQLARYSKQDYSPLREAQRKTLDAVKNRENVEMVTILDTDSDTYANIHPLGKERVAFYLAQAWRGIRAPEFDYAQIEGNSVVVHFKNLGDGLMINDTYADSGNKLCEFEVAAKTGAFTAADAIINPDGTITVSSPLVAEPLYVRYAYSGIPQNPNLFGKNGMAVSPFTTDERIYSAASFETRRTNNNAPIAVIDFDLCMLKDSVNGVVAHTSYKNTVSGWSNCGTVLRLYSNGFFEYRDGASFMTSTVTYKKDIIYHVRMAVDTENKLYSIFVTPEGGETQTVCIDAAFRNDALSMNDCGRLLVRGGEGSAACEFYITNYTSREPSQTEIVAKSGTTYAIYSDEPSIEVIDALYQGGILESVSTKTMPALWRFVFPQINGTPFVWKSLESMKPLVAK